MNLRWVADPNRVGRCYDLYDADRLLGYVQFVVHGWKAYACVEGYVGGSEHKFATEEEAKAMLVATIRMT